MKKPPRPNPKLLALWRKLKPAERVRFAALAKSTTGSLKHYAEGRRGISSDLAIRLEKASVKMRVVPIVSRMDLSDACGRCEFAKAFAKELA